MAFCYVSHQCDKEAAKYDAADAREAWISARADDLLRMRSKERENINASVDEYLQENPGDNDLAMAIMSSDQTAQDAIIHNIVEYHLGEGCRFEAEFEANLLEKEND